METKRFHLKHVLAAVTGYSHDGYGPSELFDYMDGDLICSPAGYRIATERCRPVLLKLYPSLGSPAMQKAVDDLKEQFREFAGLDYTSELGEKTSAIYTRWMKKIIAGDYGIELPLCGLNKDMLAVPKLSSM